MAPFEPVCIVIDMLVSFNFSWLLSGNGFLPLRAERLWKSPPCKELVDRAAIDAGPVQLRMIALFLGR